jgi:ABC-type multidrug transport system ATPase subunit
MAVVMEGVGRSFKKRTVLHGVNLCVPRGTAVVLQGANGSGKTTLLRILATVVRPDTGVATVAGYDVRRQGNQVRRNIGVAFVNERSIFWRLNGWENLMLFAATRGVAVRDREAHINGLVAELGMEDIVRRRVADLSTGQRQRIILARAALAEPAVLLMDEPLRGLDDEGIEQVMLFLKRRLERGASALIVAPTVSEFRDEGYELLRLREGVVEASDWAAGVRR